MHPWHSVRSTLSPTLSSSPHLLRGDTTLPLLACCTHLMFLCCFSCGLVCSQNRLLFDGPGPQDLWFGFETGHLVGNKFRQVKFYVPNLGGIGLLTSRPSTLCVAIY